jgi:hypothetical protein
MKKQAIPKFTSEDQEADWWASPAGRGYVKRRSAEAQSQGVKARGSSLVDRLNKEHAYKS